jgi:hypothetical protein
MRVPIKLNLDLIETWLSTVEIKNETQRRFVESTKRSLDDVRARNDSDIVLDVEDDVVLYRYFKGKEVMAGEEIQLYYAQAVALGVRDWSTIA